MCLGASLIDANLRMAVPSHSAFSTCRCQFYHYFQARSYRWRGFLEDVKREGPYGFAMVLPDHMNDARYRTSCISRMSGWPGLRVIARMSPRESVGAETWSPASTSISVVSSSVVPFGTFNPAVFLLSSTETIVPRNS